MSRREKRDCSQVHSTKAPQNIEFQSWLEASSTIDLQRVLNPYPRALFSSTSKHFNLQKNQNFHKEQSTQ